MKGAHKSGNDEDRQYAVRSKQSPSAPNSFMSPPPRDRSSVNYPAQKSCDQHDSKTYESAPDSL